LVQTELTVLLVLQAQPELLVQQDLKVLLVLKETLGLKDLKVSKVTKVFRERLALQALQALLEPLVLPLLLQGLQELMALLGPRDQLVLRALMETVTTPLRPRHLLLQLQGQPQLWLMT
jgi:hypothetical protein